MSYQTSSEKRPRGTKLKQPATIERTASRAPSPSPILSRPDTSTIRQSTQPNYTIPSKETYQYRVCSHPIEEICLVTNYLANIPDDFKSAMLKFICKEGLNGPSVYAECVAPPNPVTVHKINGNGGYFLKKTAEEANIYLIWYNRDRGVYMFWGAVERTVRDAMNRIRGRIVKYVVYVNSVEKPTPQTTHRSRHRDIAETPPPAPARALPPALTQKPPRPAGKEIEKGDICEERRC